MFKKRYLFLIGLFLFVLVLLSIDIESVFRIFIEINLFLFFIALVFHVIALVLRGYKWKLLIKANLSDISIIESVKVFCIGFFFSVLTPGRVGDAVRALYLKPMNFGSALSTVVMDRLSDVIILFLAAFISLIAFSLIYGVEIVPLYILLVGFVLFLAAVGIVLQKKYMRIVLKPMFNMMVPDRLKSKLKFSFHDFYDSFNNFKQNKKHILASFFVGVVDLFMAFVFAFFLAHSLNINVTFAFIILVVPIMILLDLLPISFSGIGTRDVAVIFLFSFQSLSAEQAVSFSLLYLFVAYFSVCFLGFLFFSNKPIKLDILKGR